MSGCQAQGVGPRFAGFILYKETKIKGSSVLVRPFALTLAKANRSSEHKVLCQPPALSPPSHGPEQIPRYPEPTFRIPPNQQKTRQEPPDLQVPRREHALDPPIFEAVVREDEQPPPRPDEMFRLFQQRLQSV